MTQTQLTNESKTYLNLTKKTRKIQIEAAEIPKLIQLFTEIQQKYTTSKPSAINFLDDLIFFVKVRKTDLQNEEFSKIVLKTLLEFGGKTKTVSKSISRKLIKLTNNITLQSDTFVKFLKQILKKLDFQTFNNTLDFLHELENKDILKEINDRAKIEAGKISTHRKPWNKHLFKILSKSDGLANLTIQLRNELRESVLLVRNLSDVFSDLDLQLLSDINSLDNLFDVSFNECFGKDDTLTVNLLEFAMKILKNNPTVTAKSKSEGFLVFLNQRINKNQSQEILTVFSHLIANLNFNFDQKIQAEILCNFVEVFGNIKSVVESNIISEVLKHNKSISKLKVLSYFLERKKQIEYPTAVFVLSRFINDSSDYCLFLRDFYAKNNKSKATFSNFKNLIFSFAEEIKDNNFDEQKQLDFMNRVVNKDDYLSKANIFDSLLKIESQALIQIISHISDESFRQVGFNESEKHAYGTFIINALGSYFKTWHALDTKFPKKTVKQILKSLLIILTTEPKAKIEHQKYGEIVKFLICGNSFKSKNPVMIFKIIAIISQEGLLTPTDLKTLSHSEFFKTKLEGSLPDVFYRLLSRENLLASRPDKIWSNLLVNLLYFYPEFLQQSMFFFAKRNLIYLLSMSHLTEAVNNLKSFNNNFFFSKEELEMLGLKEKTVQSKNKKIIAKEENFADVKFVSEAQNFDEQISQNEDEKFDELRLENNKAEVLQNYGLILSRLNEIYTSFFSRFSPVFTPAHLQIIENQLHLFRDSFKTVAFFSELLNGQYGCFLRHSSHNSSLEFTHLLEYNFGVVRGNDSPQFVRNLEYFIRTSDLNKINVTKEVFAILFEILSFVFENKIDTEYKRKIFYVVYKSLKAYPELVKQFFQFICKNFNDLNFEEAFESFRNILIEQMLIDDRIVDFALNDILKYEDFVVYYLLNTLHDLAKTKNIATQHVTVLQLLKILILTESDDEKTCKLAKELVEVNPLFKFGSNMVEGLSFRTIIEEFPTDLHDIIARILANVCQSLEGVQQTLFMKTLIEQTRSLVLSSDYSDYEVKTECEQKYQLFPKILFGLVTRLSESMLYQIFDYIFGILIRNRTPLFRQTFK